MYRRPKFLEILLETRQKMALEADYDVDLFVEMARSGVRPHVVRTPAPARDDQELEESDARVAELSRIRDV